MERKVFEDQLYALEERFKAWDKDMRSLLLAAVRDELKAREGIKI